MTELDGPLRAYIASRADPISSNAGDLLVTRALSRKPRSGWARHSVNAAFALALTLALIAGGLALQSQLRGLHIGAPQPSPGPLPKIPNEIVNLDNGSQAMEFVTPLRLVDGKVLTPRYRWRLSQNRALTLENRADCSYTLIHVKDTATGSDVGPPVSLPDCYMNPTVLPGTSVLLARYRSGSNNQVHDLGAVRYDWAAGQIARSYPSLSMTFVGGVVSPDGTRLYTLNPYTDANLGFDITDLVSGVRVVHVPVRLLRSGLNPGGFALAADSRTLYVNQGDGLATFDARTGAPGPVLAYTKTAARSTSWLPAGLGGIEADAKEGFEPGHGIAVDPKGRWVAALGADDPDLDGIWIFNASGPMRLVRHISLPIVRGLASSLDGSALYALELDSQHGMIDVIDPQTGQFKRVVSPRVAGFLGIAGVDAN
jgi:hypothetical protein